MADQQEIKIVITAVDKMTAVIRKACVEGEKRFSSFAKKADAISEGAAKVGKTTAVMGAAIAAPLVYATKKALEFESAMADVAKVADVNKTSAEFKQLSDSALTLSKYLGTNSEDVAKLYASLLAGGTSKGELKQVATIAGEAAVAFDMTQESAGEAFSVMKNAMGLTVRATKDAFDATNAISNTFGGKARDILEFMSAGGASTARTLKSTAPEMMAFGRALMMSGVSASEAGTVMNRFGAGLYRNAEAMKVFTGAGGGSKGMQAVFEMAVRSGDPFKWFKNHKFGEYSNSLSLLAQNSGKLGNMLLFVKDKQNTANSATKEFNSRMDTTEMRLKKAKVAFENAAIKVGSAFLPVLTRVLNTVTPMIEKLSKWISKNPALTSTIVKCAAAASVMLFTISGISFAVSGVAKALSWGGSTLTFFTKLVKMSTYTNAYWNVVTKAQTAATYAWSAAQRVAAVSSSVMSGALKIANSLFVTSPIGWIALAIGAAAFVIIKNWDKVQQFFISLWAGIRSLFNKGVAMFKEYGWYLIGPVGVIIKHWDQIKLLPKKMFEAGKNIVKSIWEGIKSFASKPVEAIKNIVKKVRDFLPFSPAKEGPLRDIHRVRLVETIAESVKPGPLVRAMRVTTAAAMLAVSPTAGKALGKTRGAGNGGNYTYSPNITVQGGSPSAKQDLMQVLREHSREFYQMVKNEERKQGRTNF